MPEKNEIQVLRVDLKGPAPVYRQIVDGLRTLLVSGAFRPGDKLPTVRQLAVDLGVNHNTVAEAYRLLSEEGWLELRRHHGAKVLERRAQKPTPASQQKFAQHLRELAARAIADGLAPKTIARQLDAFANELKGKPRTL